MGRKEFLELLALSETRVSRGANVVAQQGRLVDKLKLNGHNPELLKEAEWLLALFKEMQRLNFSTWRRLANEYNAQRKNA